ncbi:hypothetical protein QX776_05895 [Alteromonadaceae bacterium BrNp21-10]|nr:hypothetical protein [Alteromonadaceae bacterium BrNp21-10]
MQIRAEQNDTLIDFSGFSRVVAGVLDDENASYEGYDNSISLGQKSLLAVQVEGHLTDSWSLTTQLLAHSSNEQDSGIEWLYSTYQATDSWQLKLGKLRTPFFNYSDVLDIGYAYPWISPPQQVYNGFLFDSYEGASANYDLVTNSFSANVEIFWGKFEDEITVGDETVEAEVNQFRGLILNIQHNNLKLRMSNHKGNVVVALPEINGFAGALNQAGYPSMAQHLETKGDVKVFQLSLYYDALDYFVKSEIVQIKSPILVFPETNSYYISAGYIFYPFTVHATFASSHSSYTSVVSTIPSGLDPQLDTLAAGFDALYDNLGRDNLNSVTLGLRWDFRHGMALKADITHLKGDDNERSFFTISNPTAFDYKANLLQVAWEWVF